MADDTTPAPVDIDPDPDGDVDPDSAGPARPAGGSWTASGGLALILSVFWLAATMWGAHAAIVGNAADAAIALSTAASSLPVVVAASLLAGAAAGLLSAERFGGRVVRRLVAGIAAGAVCGLVTSAVILFGYGVNPSVAVLAGTVGLAAVLGGATAALPPRILFATVGATLAAFVTAAVINYFQGPLTGLLGAGDTLASRAEAVTLFAYAQSILCGIVAGAVAYLAVSRGHEGWAWPAYLGAGAGVGLLLLAADVLSRLGGASLLNFVRNLSPADRAVMEYSDSARLRNALVVGFVGGIIAMIAFGRTLTRPGDEPTAEATDEP